MWLVSVSLWSSCLLLQGVTNEHFIVWMRTAALPQFRKLYGKINTDIPAGTTLTFKTDAYFEVASFGGKKSLGEWWRGGGRVRVVCCGVAARRWRARRSLPSVRLTLAMRCGSGAVLSTVSWFGGKNNFLGISYIVVGSICLALALAFAAKQAICPRKLGDTRYLGWKEQ